MRKQLVVIGEREPCFAIVERRFVDGIRRDPKPAPGDPQAHQALEPGGAQIAEAVVAGRLVVLQLRKEPYRRRPRLGTVVLAVGRNDLALTRGSIQQAGSLESGSQLVAPDRQR